MRQKGFVLLPIIVIIVLVGALGYFIYQNTQLQKSGGNLTSPSVVPTANLPKPSPTPDPTADWKTYTNDAYGFVIKYPQDIKSMKENISDNKDKPLYVIRNNYLADNPDKYAVEVAVWDNPNKRELMDWLQYMKDSQALGLPSTDYKVSINYQVNGLKAMKFWEDPVSNGEKPGKCFQTCPATDTFFVKGDKTFRVLVVFYTEVDENLSKLPDQILSTFKFTQ